MTTKSSEVSFRSGKSQESCGSEIQIPASPYFLMIKFINLHLLFTLMKVLFICNQNKHRSKTAEELFKDKFETKSAGLYSNKPVSEKQLNWADIIMVMEEEQRHELAKRFPKVYNQKRILNLNVPDTYGYNDSHLIESLKSKVEEFSSLF